MKRGLGKDKWSDGCLLYSDLDATTTGSSLRLDLRLVAPEKDEQAALGASMLQCDSHQHLDQSGENYFT
jgi:hypothetical protein